MLLEVLSTMQIFTGLSNEQLSSLEHLFALCNCTADEIIFNQGDEAKYLYIVVKGEVAICFKPDDAEPITVAHIRENDVFGWSAAFGSGTYTSGAHCVEATQLLCVCGENLKKFNEEHPNTGILVLDRLAKVVARRLKRTHSHDQVVAMLKHGLKNGIKPIGG